MINYNYNICGQATRSSGWMSSQVNGDSLSPKFSKAIVGKVEASAQLIEEARLDLEKQLAPFYQKLLERELTRPDSWENKRHDTLSVENGFLKGCISLFNDTPSAAVQQEKESFYFELSQKITDIDRFSPLGALIDKIYRTVSLAGDICTTFVIRYWKGDLPGGIWKWHSDRLTSDLDRNIDTHRTYTATFASREEWATRIVDPSDALALCNVPDNTQFAGRLFGDEKQQEAEALGKPSQLGSVYAANNTIHRGLIPSDIDRKSIKKNEYRLFVILRAISQPQ